MSFACHYILITWPIKRFIRAPDSKLSERVCCSLGEEFATTLGFRHHRVTPLWPRANGEAEQFMDNIGKTIRAAQKEAKPWLKELTSYLRNYRATPRAAPPESHPPRRCSSQPTNDGTKLPQPTHDSYKEPIGMRSTDAERKERAKQYADQRHIGGSRLAWSPVIGYSCAKKENPSSRQYTAPRPMLYWKGTERKSQPGATAATQSLGTSRSSSQRLQPRRQPPNRASSRRSQWARGHAALVEHRKSWICESHKNIDFPCSIVIISIFMVERERCSIWRWCPFIPPD